MLPTSLFHVSGLVASEQGIQWIALKQPNADYLALANDFIKGSEDWMEEDGQGRNLSGHWSLWVSKELLSLFPLLAGLL